MTTPLEQMPSWRLGHEDGLDGWPLLDGMSEAYIDGWLSARECLALLEHGTRGTGRAEHRAWKARPPTNGVRA